MLPFVLNGSRRNLNLEDQILTNTKKFLDSGFSFFRCFFGNEIFIDCGCLNSGIPFEWVQFPSVSWISSMRFLRVLFFRSMSENGLNRMQFINRLPKQFIFSVFIYHLCKIYDQCHFWNESWSLFPSCRKEFSWPHGINLYFSLTGIFPVPQVWLCSFWQMTLWVDM